MAKITLNIDNKNLTTVLTILENLKKDLIKDISVESQNKTKPVSSSISNDINKKYLSKEKYKKRLNQKPKEDEFLVGSTSSGKYLSPNDYKRKLKGN